MTEMLTNRAEVSPESKRERRHQTRLEVKYPIEVSGFNRRGRYFTERTLTLDVSDGGCKFRLSNELEKGSVVAIRIIIRRNGREIDTRPVLFQVNWFQGLPKGWTLGVSKLQAGASWCASIPQDENISEPTV